MPVKLRRKGRCTEVRTPGGVKARCTSRKKARRQQRLLNAVEHSDWRPTRKRSRSM